MPNKRLLKIALIVLFVAVLAVAIIKGISVYPCLRAKYEVEYIPPLFIERLYPFTEISEDMYLPADMIQAVLSLPENEQESSPEAKKLEDLFFEKVGNKEAEVAYPVNHSYLDQPERYMYISSREELKLSFVSFWFRIEKWGLEYRFQYWGDGSLRRDAYLECHGIGYLIFNEDNDRKYVRKAEPFLLTPIYERDIE